MAAIRERIAEAAARVDREPGEITLIGACKRQPIDIVRQAVEAGLDQLGENRVQEARDKQPLLTGGITWHLIGPLQSNKVNQAVDLFDVIQTLDRPKIGGRLQQRAQALDRTLAVMIEVNLGGEVGKHGFAVEDLPMLRDRMRDWDRLEVRGLMAIPPFGDSAEDSRPWFRRLRELRDDLFDSAELQSAPGLLSMGMSGDFEVAIEEGATHVRVGTELFGPRP